jgi:hypothetical protein
MEAAPITGSILTAKCQKAVAITEVLWSIHPRPTGQKEQARMYC